ncbi:DUF4349 domain-containing protein [Thermoanaerobacterium butyriciformans]|uniref:DUF4349 domain-containing protein n=1 Tax=Thermoanaerobacterium butyriciformans TaxID=1702242 RepID=A0ABS4NHT3_9THEO|nr:DUF4349 domain-containing protein [Thermoanaerobacterium butyriciformans]MBP2073231.1 hypothetical protein [Thermoanaerobacterium butyriciformans]
MQCSKVKKLINFYMDKELSKRQMEEIKGHLALCTECKNDYYELESIKKLLQDMTPVELPSNFNDMLHAKLLEEKKNLESRRSYKKPIKIKFRIAAAVIASLFILSLGFKLFENKINNVGVTETALSTKSAVNYSSKTSISSGKAASDLKKDASQANAFDLNRGLDPDYKRKITKDATISIETDSADECYNKILNISKQYNGYIESSSESSTSDNKKTINVVLKIPSNDFEDVIASIKSLGDVKTIRINSNDITEQYYDVESRIKNLEIQEEKLQELLKKASNISDILQVEDKLNEVMTQIDSYKNQIKIWDNMTSMSTINLTFVSTKPQTKISKIFSTSFLNDILNAGSKSLNIFFEFLKYVFIISIYLLPFSILAYLIYVGYKLFKK